MLESEVRSLANTLMQKHGLRFWTFAFNNRTTSLGLCDYTSRKIYYSRVYLDLDAEQIADTILHEIAHALTPGNGHGYLWKKKCTEIGCKPERLANVKRRVKYRYKAICRGCGTVYQRTSIGKNATYSCPKCCKHFNPDFVITFKKVEN